MHADTNRRPRLFLAAACLAITSASLAGCANVPVDTTVTTTVAPVTKITTTFDHRRPAPRIEFRPVEVTPMPEVDPRLLKLCASPADADRELTPDDVRTLWQRDRTNLRLCAATHEGLVKSFDAIDVWTRATKAANATVTPRRKRHRL